MENISAKNNDKAEFSNNWLQKLKDESWEAELLVSTIAIFGTFQLFKTVSWLTNRFIDLIPPSQYLIAYFIVFISLMAVSILISMFLIHFVLRAYWIGLVGLNSVFPDYSIENSPYSKIFTEKIISILPKLKDSINKVDELSSVIFSAAFTFLFMFLYIAFFNSLYLLMYNMLYGILPFYILISPVVFFFIVWLLQVILGIIANIKKYKENYTIQNSFFKLTRFYYILMLGPLNKATMQIMMTFGSNFKKKKSMIALIISFLFLGFIVTPFQMFNTNIPYLIKKGAGKPNDKTEILQGFYKTENENLDFLLTPELSSDIIEGNTLKLFIPIFRYEKAMRENICGKYSKDNKKTRNEQRIDKWEFNFNCFKKYHKLYLNNRKVAADFMKYNHSITDQFGVLCYIDLKDALQGKNILTIKKEFGDKNNKEWTIPFFHNK